MRRALALLTLLLVGCAVYFFVHRSADHPTVADLDRIVQSEFEKAAIRNSATRADLPDLSSCRLVGKWTAQRKQDVDRIVDDLRGARTEHDPLKPPPGSPDDGAHIEEFLSDGRWQCTNGNEDRTWRSRWRVTEDHDNRVTIAVDDPGTPNATITRTFVFESPTVAREEGGMFSGMKFKRVRAKD